MGLPAAVARGGGGLSWRFERVRARVRVRARERVHFLLSFFHKVFDVVGVRVAIKTDEWHPQYISNCAPRPPFIGSIMMAISHSHPASYSKHFHLPLTEVSSSGQVGDTNEKTKKNIRGSGPKTCCCFVCLFINVIIGIAVWRHLSLSLPKKRDTKKFHFQNFTIIPGGYPYVYLWRGCSQETLACKRNCVAIVYWICMPLVFSDFDSKIDADLGRVFVSLWVICRQHFCRLIGLWTDLFVALW